MFNLATDTLYLLAIIFCGVCIMIFTYVTQTSTPEVEPDDRTYMDPVPAGLKLIWPFILLVSVIVENVFSNAYFDKVEKKLHKTGVNFMLTAEQFVSLRFAVALISCALSFLIVLSLKPEQFGTLFIVIATLGGFFFPLVWLADKRKRREQDVIRALPVYLDFTTMAVEAGLNLSGALQQAMNKGPEGPLRQEFSIIMRDLRAGVNRSEAFKRMAKRLDMQDISSFVNAMVQAEKSGSGMASTLRIQSEQRRNERFQRAEKKAMEAPVKLVFPLVVFIFPVTFIIVGFPIAMKVMEI
ncbi:MAG: tight adherence protein C [Cellvibrionaceae bacterium]|jgi:tight adherence protein C